MLSPNARRIAILEDDPIMGESIVQRLTLEGFDAVWWHTGKEALEALRKRRPDLMICDIKLPDMSGEEVFRDALPDLNASPILFITAYGEIDQAVRLIRAGADDYITKPFHMEDFLSRIEHLLERKATAEGGPPGTLGASKAMRRVEALLRRVADIDSTLLLTGESGVGKEVAARFVHQISRRAPRPFVAVNCAAVPAALLESELFGHERGAFTGAHVRHEGYAERARDGILFLDEICELPPPVQAKLLRLVQERVFLRLGGEKPIQFAARLVCSTNAELDRLVRAGEFRQDLYYRINVIPVHIGPLRERADDILPLLQKYVAYFALAMHSEVRGLTTGAESAALGHDWPGNVRELRNRAERAVALAAGPWLAAADLFPVRHHHDGPSQEIPSLAAARQEAERRHIMAALERTAGQVGKAAEILAVSRTTLWEKMRKLGISTDEAV